MNKEESYTCIECISDTCNGCIFNRPTQYSPYERAYEFERINKKDYFKSRLAIKKKLYNDKDLFSKL
jgi:hypothetical protein